MEKIFKKISFLLIWGLALTPCFFWLQGQNKFLLPKGYLAKIIIELLLIFYLFLLARNKKYQIKLNILNISFLAYIAISFISGLAGIDLNHSFWGSPERFLGIFDLIHLSILMLILPTFFPTKENWLNFLKSLNSIYLLISSSFYTGYIFNIFSLHKINPEIGRWVGFAGNSIYMAVFLLINSFLSLYFFFEDVEKEKRSYKFLIFFLIFSILLFATGSRGAILSYLSSLFILLVIFNLKKYVKLNNLFHINNQKISFFILLILIISAILTVSLRNSSLIQRIPPLRRLVSISVSDVSTINRIIVTKTSIQAFLQKPIWGWGANNYDIAYQNNFNPNIVKASPQEFRFDKAHNMFLEIAACSGVFGLLGYLSFFFIGYKSIIKSNYLEFFPKLALLLLILSYLVQNLFFFDVFDGFLPLIIVFSFISSLINKNYEIKSQLFAYPLIFLTIISLYQFNIKEVLYINNYINFNSAHRETKVFYELEEIRKFDYPYTAKQKDEIEDVENYLNMLLSKYPHRWRTYLAGLYFILLQTKITPEHKIPDNLVLNAKNIYLLSQNNSANLPDVEKLYLQILKYSSNPQDKILYNQNYNKLIQTYPNINWDK